jgi:uncharacterized protein
MSVLVEQFPVHRKWWYPASIGLAVFLTTPQALADPINCRYANSRVEREICNSDRLVSLDRRVDRAYRRAVARGDTSEREQRRWLRQRDGCGRDEVCLAGAYRDRLNELRD